MQFQLNDISSHPLQLFADINDGIWRGLKIVAKQASVFNKF
jgi:hypothetical protein